MDEDKAIALELLSRLSENFWGRMTYDGEQMSALTSYTGWQHSAQQSAFPRFYRRATHRVT